MDFIIEAARSNPLAFGQYVFGHEPEDFHREWATMLATGCNSLAVAPRGSAKTTWLLIFLLHQISTNPEKANLLLAATPKQAGDRLNILRDTIQNNKRYQRVFPHIQIATDQPSDNTQFSLAGSDNIRPTLQVAWMGAYGITGSIDGVLAIDEPINEQTESNQEYYQEWLDYTIIPMLDGGVVWYFTSIFSENDMCLYFYHGNLFVQTRFTPALWKTTDGILVSYWEGPFPVSRLFAIYDAVGREAFKLAYMGGDEWSLR